MKIKLKVQDLPENIQNEYELVPQDEIATYHIKNSDYICTRPTFVWRKLSTSGWTLLWYMFSEIVAVARKINTFEEND